MCEGGLKVWKYCVLNYHTFLVKSLIFFPKHSTNLDLSYKTDLDFWDCSGWGNPIPEFNKTDSHTAVILEREITK